MSDIVQAMKDILSEGIVMNTFLIMCATMVTFHAVRRVVETFRDYDSPTLMERFRDKYGLLYTSIEDKPIEPPKPTPPTPVTDAPPDNSIPYNPYPTDAPTPEPHTIQWYKDNGYGMKR